MAEQTQTQVTEEQEEAQEAQGGGMMKKLLLGVVALLLVGVGAAVGLLFMGGEEAADGEEVVEEAEEPVAPGDGPTFYTNLAPPLVVNFKDQIGDDHVMQVTLEMMARDQATINEVREHIPVIRNALILLYSSYLYEDVSTREGKEKMLSEGLAEIRRLMQKRIGKPAIEEIYFTGLVIQ